MGNHHENHYFDREKCSMQKTKRLPREKGFDHSINLMREGYRYILNRRQSLQSDLFETRLMGQTAVCMGGKEAVELFYDNEKFQRQGAAPNRVRETLFGEKGVQTLDGEAHKHRKTMFMSLMSSEKLADLANLTKKAWEHAVRNWEQTEQVILYEEAKKMFCQVACEWAGVPLKDNEWQERTDALSSLFESPTKIGPNHWRGRHGRNVVENWIAKIITDVREEKLKPMEGTALHTFSWHRDVNEQLLSPEVAAVEVINILRPIIAIAVYVCFIVLALKHYPNDREKVISDFEQYADPFIHEVRRFYPFFPYTAARVKQDFTWNGFTFKRGTLTLLDLYGTNHDPKLWENPDLFKLDRFIEKNEHVFTLIPQGGGEHVTGHRCAGEAVTIEVMKMSLNFLVNRIEYKLPEQDLSYSLVDMPSIPKSKVILTDIKKKR